MSMLTHLSREHGTLLMLIADVQQAAEAKDRVALRVHLTAAWDALTRELDAHMALEEEVAFPPIGRTLGEEFLKPFEEEHREIRALRDLLLEWVDAGKAPVDLCLILCNLIIAHMQREELALFSPVHQTYDLVEGLDYG